MKLSVKIMAHKKRAHFIPELVERLGLTDEDVIWDTNNNRWHTGRRAWEAVDRDADWGLVVQDDALVCRDLIAGLETALNHIPQNSLLSPYVGTRRPMSGRVERVVQEAIAEDAAFIQMPSLNWGVAIGAPTHIIPKMLPWCDKQQYPNYDRRIGRFAIDVMRYSTWCTWPSLVDHREVPSLVGHGGGRVAHHFVGEETSALDIDWSKGSVTLGATRTSARYLPTSDGYNRAERGYRVARYAGTPAKQLRVPKPTGLGHDQPPQRPKGGGS
jgi:hypothetical protein